MKKSSTYVLVSACAIGLLAGFVTRRLAPGPATANAPASTSGKNSRTAPQRQANGAAEKSTATRSGRTAPEMLPHPRSADTLESLLALKDDELYSRLAAWLTDAGEPEIAAFWKEYGPRKGRSNDITDLVFLNWTRLDPQAAIAGSSSDQHAWWAWACHDPEGALAEAKANAPDHINHVAWGIGEFHPDWLREHFKELSKGAQDNALQGLAKWDDGQDPLAAMKFLKEIGRSVTQGTFKALIRQDPWAALDWAKENPGRGGGSGFDYSLGDPIQLIVDTMATERPDDLKRLAAQTPSGAAKLKMESALFESLLKSDPKAALEEAKSTVAPRVAAERYAAIGQGMVKTDPEQAFGLAKELFAKCPDGIGMSAKVEYPDGWSERNLQLTGVTEFFTSLMNKDPARTLEMVPKASALGSGPFSELSNQWVQRDFVAYTNWVNQQTDPALHDQGANVIINNLQQQGNYAESADWILSRKEGAGGYGISDMLANWKRTDAHAAAGWLEESDLPEARKSELRTMMDKVK